MAVFDLKLVLAGDHNCGGLRWGAQLDGVTRFVLVLQAAVWLAAGPGRASFSPPCVLTLQARALCCIAC
jgi:hypothetical protein